MLATNPPEHPSPACAFDGQNSRSNTRPSPNAAVFRVGEPGAVVDLFFLKTKILPVVGVSYFEAENPLLVELREEQHRAFDIG